MENSQKSNTLNQNNQNKIIQNENELLSEYYTESISFYHHDIMYEYFEPMNITIFPIRINGNFYAISPTPFLLTQEYAFGTLGSIESDKYLNSSLSLSPPQEIKQIILSRIQQFSNKNNSDEYKLAFISNISSYLDLLDMEHISNYLLPSFSMLIDESYKIRLNFLKVHIEVIHFLASKGEDGYKCIVNNCLNLINEFFNKKTFETIEMGKILYENYSQIARNLKQDDLIKFVLTKIISITNFDSEKQNDLDNLILIMKTMGDLSEKFGVYNETFIVPQIKMLSQNKHDIVKIGVCKILPKVCKNISFQCIDTKINPILSYFITNCSDPIRLSAINILCNIMEIYQERGLYNKNIKNTFYIELFKNLIYDNTKEIHYASFNILGKFISLLDKEEVDNSYLQCFTSIIDQYYFNRQGNNNIQNNVEIIISAAINFPSILYRYGKESWSTLKRCYINLSKEDNPKVLLSLVSSFHEFINILGENITKNDLIPVYHEFLEAGTASVRFKAKDNLINVLQYLNLEERKPFFNEYKEYFGNKDLNNINDIDFQTIYFSRNDWRKKIEECKVIHTFYKIFNDDVIENKITPFLINFCLDDFFKVRKKASRYCADILIYLFEINEEKNSPIIKKIVECFAYSISYNMRIEFVKLFEFLTKNQKIYYNILKDILLILSYDKINGTRIAISKVIYNFVIKKEHYTKNYLLYDDVIVNIINRYFNDNIKSVRTKLELIKDKIHNKIKNIQINNTENEKEFYYIFNNNMMYLNEKYGLSLPTEVLRKKKKEDIPNDYLKVEIESYL